MSDNLAALCKLGKDATKGAIKLSVADDKGAKLALDTLNMAYDIKVAQPEAYRAKAAGAARLAATGLSLVLKKYGVDTSKFDAALSTYDTFLTMYAYGAAFTGKTVLDASTTVSTCVAAWGGANVAHVAIKGIRAIDPKLGTNPHTEAIENVVFSKLGGGAANGASYGAAIGMLGGPAGAAAGAALGGVAGSVVGLISFAVTGAPPPPGGCFFYVEAGEVDVNLHIWGPGGGGGKFCKHTEFAIKPGTHFIEKCDQRDIQLVVNGKLYELKNVIRNYKFVVIDNTGAVQVTRSDNRGDSGSKLFL